MDVKKIAVWAGVGLIVFGAFLIVAQIILTGQISNAPVVQFLGATLTTTFLGLIVLFIGAVIVAAAAFGRQNSN